MGRADMRLRTGRLALLLAALCVPGLLALATPSGAAVEEAPAGRGPVSSSAHDAAAEFTGLEYSVPFYGRLFSTSTRDEPDAPQASTTSDYMYFGDVHLDMRAGSNLDLSIAVEGQPDASSHQFCNPPDDCDDVTVRATSEGLLYLHVSRDRRNLFIYLGGFPLQPVELSASDAGSELKVYREVLVGPSPTAGGCEDYGDDTPEAYTCLFLRELLPPAPARTDVAALRTGLPELVQDSDNYRLVFAEEFNGTPPAANADGCRDGLSTLDDAVWNYYNACSNLDSRGEPCGNVVNGALVMGDAGRCKAGLTAPFGSFILGTYGKLQFRYGYLEMKYTVNADRWQGLYSNYNLILFPRGERLRYLWDQYGVEIQDLEDFLTTSEVEIDIVEYDANSRSDVAHQYLNWGFAAPWRHLTPTRTNKRIFYCNSDPRSIVESTKQCRSSDTFTVTRGIEWTPRGYRTYIKVDGFHSDGLTLVPKDKIEVETKKVIERNGALTARALTEEELSELNSGEGKDRYFEYLDPGDTSTLMEQASIAHVPLPIAMSVWGFLDADINPYIRTRMKIDYIRVWQPQNRYTDMEPVYQ